MKLLNCSSSYFDLSQTVCFYHVQKRAHRWMKIRNHAVSFAVFHSGQIAVLSKSAGCRWGIVTTIYGLRCCGLHHPSFTSLQTHKHLAKLKSWICLSIESFNRNSTECQLPKFQYMQLVLGYSIRVGLTGSVLRIWCEIENKFIIIIINQFFVSNKHFNNTNTGTIRIKLWYKGNK